MPFDQWKSYLLNCSITTGQTRIHSASAHFLSTCYELSVEQRWAAPGRNGHEPQPKVAARFQEGPPVAREGEDGCFRVIFKAATPCWGAHFSLAVPPTNITQFTVCSNLFSPISVSHTRATHRLKSRGHFINPTPFIS